MTGLNYKTLRENIADEIRKRIVHLEYEPGNRIIETALAEEFQVSRAPIREALRQLENEGYLEYSRNAGCRVRSVSFEDAYEIYLLRTSYETLAVKLLNGNVPDEIIDRMENILEDMKQVDMEHYLDVFDNDVRFHKTLIDMVELPRLYKAWEVLNHGNVASIPIEEEEKRKIIEKQVRLHKPILEACRKKDVSLICHEITEHYFSTIRIYGAKIGKTEGSVHTWEFLR